MQKNFGSNAKCERGVLRGVLILQELIISLTLELIQVRRVL